MLRVWATKGPVRGDNDGLHTMPCEFEPDRPSAKTRMAWSMCCPNCPEQDHPFARTSNAWSAGSAIRPKPDHPFKPAWH